MRPLSLALVAILCLLTTACQSTARLDKPSPTRFGSVATVNPIATDAAMNVLRSGGNAIDAGVAAMLTLGVVDNHNSGIGGGCFIVARLATGEVFVIDARETAPALATRNMFDRDGKLDPTLSQLGALAVATPGALRGYELALQKAGTKSLANLLTPAADLAERGFPIDRVYASRIADKAAELKQFPASRDLLLPDGKPLVEGDTLRQPDLASTYRQIAQHGTSWFYAGEFATRVGEWMQHNRGLLRASDFAGYTAKLRSPIVSTYRGYTIIGMPPPSSGGIHVAQILTMLERFDLATLSDADRVTTMANAMSLAFADRAFWLGDPDFANVPAGLIDRNYLTERSKLIDTKRAIAVDSHGTPPAADRDFFERQASKHTTHVSVADAAGNVVAITATINTTFGSKVIVPGTGVFLNNEMDDLTLAPGVPNHFGLVGQEANAVAPLKRPLSSMSPTIVLKDGKVAYVLGAAGGPRIITQVVNVLTNLIDRNMSPEQAMKSPRLHHQWRPGELWIENTIGDALLTDLTARGFKLNAVKPIGATNLVVLDPNGAQTAVSEPRLPSKAASE
jgi:gamma-glutamyltranspeptidase / glutathione hydrolase